MNFSFLGNSRWILNIAVLALILALVVIAVVEPGLEKPPAVVKLTALTPAQIDHLHITHKGNEIELVKQKGGWVMQQPLQVRANDAKISALLGIVTAKSHAHFQRDKLKLPKLKLDPPNAILVLNNDTRIALGNNEPIDYRRYAMVGDQVYLITDRYYYHLAAGVYSFVSPALLAPGAKIDRILLPQGIELTNKSGSWEITPPKPWSADVLTTFIDTWKHAQALEVAAFDGKAPKQSVDVYINHDPQPLRFHIRKQAAQTWLVRTDLGIQYQLTDDSAKQLLDISSHVPAAVEQSPTNK